MVDNWERAIPTLHDGNRYVTFIGDDDGLLPGALRFAAQVLKLEPTPILSWKKAEYCWPDVGLSSMKGYLQFRLSSEIRRTATNEFLRQIHCFSCGYDQGPSLYSSFVKAELIRHVVKQDGQRFFRSCSPDVYSSFILSAYTNTYLRCSFPLSVNGASGASNGIAHATEVMTEEASTFLSRSTFHPLIRYAAEDGQQPVSMAIAETDSLATAHDFHSEALGDYKIDIDSLAAKMYHEFLAIPETSRRRSGLEFIYRRLSNKSEIPRYDPRQKGIDSGFTRGVKMPGSDLEIVADLSSLGDTNVLVACQYIHSIFDLTAIELNVIGSPEISSERAIRDQDNIPTLKNIRRKFVRAAQIINRLLKMRS
jgi:hypothetical protein